MIFIVAYKIFLTLFGQFLEGGFLSYINKREFIKFNLHQFRICRMIKLNIKRRKKKELKKFNLKCFA